ARGAHAPRSPGVPAALAFPVARVPARVSWSDTTASPAPTFASPVATAIEPAANVRVLTMQAQEAFLRVNRNYTEAVAGLLRFQTRLLHAMAGSGVLVSREPEASAQGNALASGSRLTEASPRSLTY